MLRTLWECNIGKNKVKCSSALMDLLENQLISVMHKYLNLNDAFHEIMRCKSFFFYGNQIMPAGSLLSPLMIF